MPRSSNTIYTLHHFIITFLRLPRLSIPSIRSIQRSHIDTSVSRWFNLANLYIRDIILSQFRSSAGAARYSENSSGYFHKMIPAFIVSYRINNGFDLSFDPSSTIMFPSFNFFPRPWRPPSPHDLRANLWNRFLFYLMTQLGSSSLLGYSKIDRRYPGYRINSSRSFFFVRFFIYFSIIISSKYIFLSKSSFERKEEGKQPSLDLGSYYKTAALYIYIYIPDIFEPWDRTTTLITIHFRNFQRRRKPTRISPPRRFPPRRYARGDDADFPIVIAYHARRMQSYIDASNRSATRDLCGGRRPLLPRHASSCRPSYQ